MPEETLTCAKPAWRPKTPDCWIVFSQKADIPRAREFLRALHTEIHDTLLTRHWSRDEKLPKALERMLPVLEKRSKITTNGREADAQIIANIARLDEWWIRPIEAWQPTSKNIERQLLSLIQHLFAKYPKEIQGYWLSAFVNVGKNAYRANAKDCERSLFLHICEGKNLRTYQPLPLPIEVTKKMAHIFLTENVGKTVEEQLRYAQLKTLGITPRQIPALLNHRSAAHTGAETETWKLTFYHLVAQNPMLDPERIAEMLDFIQHEATRHRTPNERAFCMKGRTAESILRQSAEWHRHLIKAKRTSNHKWPGQAFAPYSFQAMETEESGETHPKGPHWTITELTSAQELIAEGRNLKHCVSSYASSCVSGSVSIWSLRADKDRCLTIEVRRDGQITQIRGRCNRTAHAYEMTHIYKWANENGLTVKT